MTPIDEIVYALAAATATPDREVRAIYVAIARSKLSELQARVAALEITISARERELLRVAGGAT